MTRHYDEIDQPAYVEAERREARESRPDELDDARASSGLSYDLDVAYSHRQGALDRGLPWLCRCRACRVSRLTRRDARAAGLDVPRVPGETLRR